MNRRIHKLIGLRGCALAVLAAAITRTAFAQAAPQVITVANLFDSGPGSLRQAITTANASASRTTIRFALGLAGTILLTSGELRITASMVIAGPGADTLTISGNQASRVFAIARAPAGGNDLVSIHDLTIRDGFAAGNAVPPGRGGGIYVQGAILTLSGVGIANNSAAGGVGGSAAGGGVCGTASIVTIGNSTISGNQAVGGGDALTVNGTAMGGGIALDSGSLTLDNNTFSGNQAVGGSALGGAIAFTGGANDTLSVQSNSISGNQALGGGTDTAGGNALGGALFVSGKLAPTKAMFRRTRLVGNIAGRRSRGGSSGGSSLGGGLFVDKLASVTFVQVVISGNLLDGPWDLQESGTTVAEGGGAYVGTGGTLILNDTAVTLNSVLPNTTGPGAPGNSAGGGVFVASGGTLVLEGSTTVEQNFARNYSNLYPPPSGKP